MSFARGREHRFLRMVRSTTSLIVIAAALGLALALALGAMAWLIASTLHHASNA
jgi:hypothetical protein